MSFSLRTIPGFANQFRSRTLFAAARGVRTVRGVGVLPAFSQRTMSEMTSADAASLKQTIANLFGPPAVSDGWVGGFPGALRQVFPSAKDHADLLQLIALDESSVVDICFDLGRHVTVHFRDGSPPLAMSLSRRMIRPGSTISV